MKTIAQLCDDILSGETVLAAHRIGELRQVMLERYPEMEETRLQLSEMRWLAERITNYITSLKLGMRDE